MFFTASKYKQCAFLLICLIVLSCGNVPRDNVLDPQNPESTSIQKHLIEAFVNISDHPSGYNQIMLSALDSLEHLYSDRLIVTAYHRTVGEYSDPCHRAANDIRYDKLLEAGQFTLKGVPDVFFNGVSGRIQGASTFDHVFFRLQQVLLTEMSDNFEYSLNTDVTLDSGELTTTVTLARLGNQSAGDIRLRAVVIADKTSEYFHNAVVASVESDLIEELPQGSIKEITLPALDLSGPEHKRLIVSVVNENAVRVYQTDWLELNQ